MKFKQLPLFARFTINATLISVAIAGLLAGIFSLLLFVHAEIFGITFGEAWQQFLTLCRT